LVTRARIDRIVHNGSNVTSTSGLRIGVGTTRTDASNAEDDTNNNANDGSSGEDNTSNDGNGRAATVSLTEIAGSVDTIVKLALVFTSISAVYGDVETTTEGVANVVSAEVVVHASLIGVDAAENSVASIDGADALIIAILGLIHTGINAAEAHIALVESAEIVIIAVGSIALPLAKLGQRVANITRALVAIAALSIRSALGLTSAERGGAADTSGGLAGISEASSIGLARNWSLDASTLRIRALILLALVVSVDAVLRSRLATNTADVVGAAE